MTVSASRQRAAQAVLDGATASGNLNAALCAVGDQNGLILTHAAGYRDAGRTLPIATDAIVAIASMTKLITTIAALQLVEKDSLALDIPIDSYLPELKNPAVLTGFNAAGDPQYTPAHRAPTARELMTHTSGYVYSIWNETLLTAEEKGIVEGVLGSEGRFLKAPLAFQPGERWEYGIGIDWLGALIERISGQRLLNYFEEHIFYPLGMTDTGYEFDAAKLDRAVSLMMRVEGALIEAPVLQATPAEHGSSAFYSGGGELYSTLEDYSKILTALLNGGVCNGAQLLNQETVAGMFENHIGHLEVPTGRTQMPELSNDFDMGFGAPATWGLGFLRHETATPNGRSAGSVSWAGLFNSYYWIDPAKGIFGLFSTQVLPFYDPQAIDTLCALERAIYGLD